MYIYLRDFVKRVFVYKNNGLNINTNLLKIGS